MCRYTAPIVSDHYVLLSKLPRRLKLKGSGTNNVSIIVQCINTLTPITIKITAYTGPIHTSIAF